MAKVSISEAIRMAGVSRSHFYSKYINRGLISVEIDGDKKLIDISDLVRVFGSIQLENNKKEHNKIDEYTDNISYKDGVIRLLEQQLQESKQRETEAKNREEWLQKQIDELRAQQSNLLENKLQRKKFLGIF